MTVSGGTDYNSDGSNDEDNIIIILSIHLTLIIIFLRNQLEVYFRAYVKSRQLRALPSNYYYVHSRTTITNNNNSFIIVIIDEKWWELNKIKNINNLSAKLVQSSRLQNMYYSNITAITLKTNFHLKLYTDTIFHKNKVYFVLTKRWNTKKKNEVNKRRYNGIKITCR